MQLEGQLLGWVDVRKGSVDPVVVEFGVGSGTVLQGDGGDQVA